MSKRFEDDIEADDEFGGRPSKSARKREATAAQDLGTTLISLRETELQALSLPEPLLDAIHEAQRLTHRGALARQRQYIGKLMRELDPEPIRELLASRDKRTAEDAERFRRVEAWRSRLLGEGESALDDLMQWYGDIDRSEWARRVMMARQERDRLEGGTGTASRELFRALRSLLERKTEASDPLLIK